MDKRENLFPCVLCLPQTMHTGWKAFAAHQAQYHVGPVEHLVIANETGRSLDIQGVLMGNTMQVTVKHKAGEAMFPETEFRARLGAFQRHRNVCLVCQNTPFAMCLPGLTALLAVAAVQFVAKVETSPPTSPYDPDALHAWTPDEPMPSGRAAWLCVTCGTRLTPETGVQPPAKGCLRKGLSL